MRYENRAEMKTETRLLGLFALLCYSAMVAAMFVGGYALLGLALQAFGGDFALMLNPPLA